MAAQSIINVAGTHITPPQKQGTHDSDVRARVKGLVIIIIMIFYDSHNCVYPVIDNHVPKFIFMVFGAPR